MRPVAGVVANGAIDFGDLPALQTGTSISRRTAQSRSMNPARSPTARRTKVLPSSAAFPPYQPEQDVVHAAGESVMFVSRPGATAP